MEKRAVVAQLGGPTAVINSTLAGIYSAMCRTEHWQVYGSIGGIRGLSEGTFTELNDSVLKSRYLPGAILRSGRTEATPEVLERIVGRLVEFKMDALILTGGNGTMWVAHQINLLCKQKNLTLSVIGIPKTVDNDIVGIDHSPGFPSAAKFISQAVADIRLDLCSMQGFEQVRVVETMGRNVGWLTAAAGFFDEDGHSSILLLPESPFDLNKCICRVQDEVQRRSVAMVIIGEGTESSCGTIIGGRKLRDNGPVIPGGVASKLAGVLRRETGFAIRDEALGVLQRCSRIGSSALDYDEAFHVGTSAVELLEGGISGVMVTLEREQNTEYKVKYATAPLAIVAGVERPIPLSLIDTDFGIKKEFFQWLQPLVSQSMSDESAKDFAMTNVHQVRVLSDDRQMEC